MKDVIIVGGGLTGMLTARALHDAGLSVMLVEQGELGRESSWAGSGILSALYPWRESSHFNQWAQYGQQHYPALCAELEQTSKLESQLLHSGMLVLNTHRKECDTAQAWGEHYQSPTQILDTVAVREREPRLADTTQAAILLPDIQQVRPPRLVQAVAASLRQRRILVSEHYPVKGLKVKKGQVHGIKLHGDTFKAGKVILTTGVWTRKFVDMEALVEKQKVFREHLVLFRGQPGLLKHIVVKDGYYLVPRQDGRIICGAVQNEGKPKPTDTEAAVKQLQRFAFALLPDLKTLTLSNHWTGRYTQTPDNLPKVGQHPEIAGLYFNIGHSNQGLVSLPASIQKLLDLVLE